MKILLVKMSSLGDILHTFPVAEYLKKNFPDAEIHWAVEKKLAPVLALSPHVEKAIPIPMQEWRKKQASFQELWGAVAELRRETYQFVFDLQGNCKSGLVTFFSRSKAKVGFSLKCAREWPNVLATRYRFSVNTSENIRAQYLSLVSQFCKIAPKKPAEIPVFSSLYHKVMVCPGSKWKNKQLPKEKLLAILQTLEKKQECRFFLVWGNDEEKAYSAFLASGLTFACLMDKMDILEWHNHMRAMDLVVAMDSSALHLAGVANVPTLSFFGPTSSQVFKPLGSQHTAFQGTCPYGQVFLKQCPFLRTCPTGACMHGITI